MFKFELGVEYPVIVELISDVENSAKRIEDIVLVGAFLGVKGP